MKSVFQAFAIGKNAIGDARGDFTLLELDDLDKGEVPIKVRFSSVNYKGALAGTGYAE